MPEIETFAEVSHEKKRNHHDRNPEDFLEEKHFPSQSEQASMLAGTLTPVSDIILEENPLYHLMSLGVPCDRGELVYLYLQEGESGFTERVCQDPLTFLVTLARGVNFRALKNKQVLYIQSGREIPRKLLFFHPINLDISMPAGHGKEGLFTYRYDLLDVAGN